jgi:glutamate dehydrogenase (NAD(P)+)
MEFDRLDVNRLQRLGIQVDRLGPRLVVCMWDEESDLEVGGYLVVDNLAMGRPSMGVISSDILARRTLYRLLQTQG